MRAPNFWKEKTLLSTALLPVSALYNGISKARRKSASPKTLPAKIICIGNVVAGGAGKTPIALALGTLLKNQGRHVHYLSRGYKSANTGVTRVDIDKHTAQEVGDEPLLLAEVLPTWVSKDRVAGAEAAIQAGAEIIIMDDGFQNPSLHKDVSLLVIDGHYGFGNERIIPAGPLREGVADAMRRSSAVIMVGNDLHNALQYAPADMKKLRAEIKPVGNTDFLKDKQVVAFCGIARPRKFYRALQQLGAKVMKHVSYPDHHRFKPEDLVYLRTKARELESILVTTEKDFVRLPEDMRAEVNVLPVEAVFSDNEALLRVINS